MEEPEDTTPYRDGTDTLKQLQVSNLTNLALVQFKRNKPLECIAFCDKALEIDNKWVKALFWKARALHEEADYDEAIQVLKDALGFEPDNQEVKKQLQTTV